MSKKPATYFQEISLLADEYVKAQRKNVPTAYQVRFKRKIEQVKEK